MRTDQPALYRIRVEGRLDASWSDRMGGLAIEYSGVKAPITTLTGRLADQSALHGVLHTLLELHLPILSTERLEGPARIRRARWSSTACTSTPIRESPPFKCRRCNRRRDRRK